MNKPTIGILAYGSLIPNPGAEIEKARIDVKKNVKTPFRVEFARSSQSRGGAPTLVPVESYGAPVNAQVIVVDLREADAASALWRRELNKVGSVQPYLRPAKVTTNSVLVERLENVAGIDVVLYTKIAATIEPLTAARLAELAIASVGKAENGRDGITYLIDAKANGISTPLSPAYEAEILKRTQRDSLEQARKGLSS